MILYTCKIYEFTPYYYAEFFKLWVADIFSLGRWPFRNPNQKEAAWRIVGGGLKIISDSGYDNKEELLHAYLEINLTRCLLKGGCCNPLGFFEFNFFLWN